MNIQTRTEILQDYEHRLISYVSLAKRGLLSDAEDKLGFFLFKIEEHSELLAQQIEALDLVRKLKYALPNAIKLLKQAEKSRIKANKATSLRKGFFGIYQDLIDGRLPIDIDYFKAQFEVITEDGKSVLVHKGTRHPASWRGKNANHVTLNDYSGVKPRHRIYKTHRIVYAIHTGVDCVESDIGFIDGNVDNYHFSNLVYKG